MFLSCRSRLISHGIYNHTQNDTRWFNFNCAKSRNPTRGQVPSHQGRRCHLAAAVSESLSLLFYGIREVRAL